jgi:phage gpG-like protein
MTGVFDLLGFAAHVHVIDAELKDIQHAILVRACEMICDEAKRVLGEGYPGWPALQPETLAKKIGPGPLLETGELRASIEWHVEGNEGQVGSNSDKAVWHELGTSKIPPRPFLMGAAMHEEAKIHAMAAKAVHAVMAGKGLRSAELAELLHLLKHIGRSAKESTERLFEDPNDEKEKRR